MMHKNKIFGIYNNNYRYNFLKRVEYLTNSVTLWYNTLTNNSVQGKHSPRENAESGRCTENSGSSRVKWCRSRTKIKKKRGRRNEENDETNQGGAEA